MLRHVLTPIVTMLGMDLGYFLGGVLIIESIFGIPGVGQLAYASISTLDIPMITGTVMVGGGVYGGHELHCGCDLYVH